MFAWSRFFSESYRTLWKKDEPVWAILNRIEEILKSFHFSIECPIPKGVYLDGPIAIGKGTILEPGAYIQGPCVIGRNCLIRHAAFLRGGVLCEDNCVVGHASEIKNSILFRGAQIAHLNYVGDSIIGQGVNLGAGVKCANLRFDRREIRVAKIPTGLKKFGSIIGDGSQIGCNVVLNPGTLIGKNCFSYPLINLHGIIPDRTRIRGKVDELQLDPLELEILETLR